MGVVLISCYQAVKSLGLSFPKWELLTPINLRYEMANFLLLLIAVKDEQIDHPREKENNHHSEILLHPENDIESLCSYYPTWLLVFPWLCYLNLVATIFTQNEVVPNIKKVMTANYCTYQPSVLNHGIATLLWLRNQMCEGITQSTRLHQITKIMF